MAHDPRFPQVQFVAPGDSPHGSDNFQHVPTLPRVAPFGALERSAMFPGSGGSKIPGPKVAQTVDDPHHYINSITGNFTGAALNPFLLIQRNDVRRNALGFRNTQPAGGSNLLIDFGKPPGAESWLVLAPQAIVFFDESVPQDDVYVNGSAAPWSVAFIYSTIPDNAT